MAAMTDVLVPALEDAREAHAAVVDRFRTDVNSTPPGARRQRLERHIAEAEDHLERIEGRVREIRPDRGALSAAGQFVRSAAHGAVRVAMLPVEVTVAAMTEMADGEKLARERRLLKNTEDEYAAAARAMAACQAGENIAEQLHDRETADLLRMLRRQEEQLLESLEENLTERARAVAAASNGRPPAEAEVAEGGLLDAVMRTVRAAVNRLRAAFRSNTRRVRSTAEGAWREMPDATRMAEGIQGAVTREQDLPISGFSKLGVPEIQQRLRGLSQRELTVIEGYERAHSGRPGVLNSIEQLREAEPWAGYDTMDAERIRMHLPDVSDRVVRQVLEYERHHRQRDTVINAAEKALRAASEATHRAEGEASGTAARKEDLPIPGYGQLGITEVRQRLQGLSRPDLAVIEDWERAHSNRQAVLDAIEEVRRSKP
ncbi:hypothetical protein PV416_01095 [Streptomyces ipomoeae]|uniref:Uncharacterized protein n=1 Tax=Streptomyces ipomoeae 91-03 TaxID=698759 RepID=L1KI58_9ACTN|nr:hypothetical protein [Streptomyces ipomoeae]EKX60170.1 hypothetical protein STRIP9103_09457 [Streptomyces ipomoeae 91-03]MDX2693644.1 hypothetical protein [Streptomyces ipomoeae]MDX2819713.1 hypothetical protein [Streptomyces ipomoeae]MDX2838108.1 hypothetical protein [Streptomyces ipomoeae]MDX2876176.1 hypothetical protein [Streptomyces ipomoeae]